MIKMRSAYVPGTAGQNYVKCNILREEYFVIKKVPAKKPGPVFIFKRKPEMVRNPSFPG
jgi:hypothetical protein